jgi:hypothetical protein
MPSLRPEAPLFPPPLLELSRLRAESLSLATPRQEPERPAGMEQRLSQEPVRLEVAWAVDELLLTVAVREATAAERETWVALLNHQILIRRRWLEA